MAGSYQSRLLWKARCQGTFATMAGSALPEANPHMDCQSLILEEIHQLCIPHADGDTAYEVQCWLPTMQMVPVMQWAHGHCQEMNVGTRLESTLCKVVSSVY